MFTSRHGKVLLLHLFLNMFNVPKMTEIVRHVENDQDWLTCRK